MSVRDVIARNTVFNALGRSWESVVDILLSLYVIERIGMAGWGLWAMVSVLTGYASLLDFGIGSGFSKFVAEHAAKGESRKLSSVVTTGLLSYLVIGVLMVGIGWPCVDYIVALMERVNLLGNPGATTGLDMAEVRFIFRWGLVLFAMSNCFMVFTAIQTGLQRMGITNILGFASSLVKIITTVVFLEAGLGVRGLIYSNAIATLVFVVASVVVAFYLVPSLRLSLKSLDAVAMRRLFNFGWRAQVSKLANLIMMQTDKVIVVMVFAMRGWLDDALGLKLVLPLTAFALVGLYDRGVALANKVRQVPVLLCSALVPAASDLDARNEHESLKRLYEISTKYTALIAVPLVAMTCGGAGMLMRTWLGDQERLDIAVWVLRIITAGYLANVLAGAGVSIALGKGRADMQMRAGLISMTSNIVMTIMLVVAVGFYGIPIATSVAMVVSCVWFLHAMKGLTDVSISRLLSFGVKWPAVAAVPGFALCIAGDVLSAGWDGRLVNAGLLLCCWLLAGISYIAILCLSPFFDAFDADFIESTLKLGKVPGVKSWLGRFRRV